jgi:hypothetical protein
MLGTKEPLITGYGAWSLDLLRGTGYRVRDAPTELRRQN